MKIKIYSKYLNRENIVLGNCWLNLIKEDGSGVLEEWLYCDKILNVVHLRERLIEEWKNFDNKIIVNTIEQWCIRLQVCVQAKNWHFEHSLWDTIKITCRELIVVIYAATSETLSFGMCL